MDEQLTAILAELDQNPANGKALAALTVLYVAPDMTPNQRERMRAKVSGIQALLAALHQWGAAVPQTDPARYVRLRLIVVSLTDGQPDTYQSGVLVENLLKWAHRHGVDPRPHVEAVQRLSSPVVSGIMGQRLLAWNRAREFVDGQIEVLLDALRRKGRDFEAMEGLTDIYLHPDTTQQQRHHIRKMVTTKPQIVEGFEEWQPAYKHTDPERFYRLSLAAISLTDAMPDWQGAVDRVIALRQFARKNGVDPEEHVTQISNISTQRTAQVIRRQR